MLAIVEDKRNVAQYPRDAKALLKMLNLKLGASWKSTSGDTPIVGFLRDLNRGDAQEQLLQRSPRVAHSTSIATRTDTGQSTSLQTCARYQSVDMESTAGPPITPPGDPPPETSWGFSGHVVTLVRTRDQAEATIRFLGFIRKTIVGAPRRGMVATPAPPGISPDEARRWAVGGLGDVERAALLMRALEQIALDPDGRADALLALDSHMACLRGSFNLGETATG